MANETPPSVLFRIERGERLFEVIGCLRSVAKNLGMADAALALDLALTAAEDELGRMRGSGVVVPFAPPQERRVRRRRGTGS